MCFLAKRSFLWSRPRKRDHAVIAVKRDACGFAHGIRVHMVKSNLLKGTSKLIVFIFYCPESSILFPVKLCLLSNEQLDFCVYWGST